MNGVQLFQGYKATARSSLLFATKSPGVPGTHLIEDTHWFWNWVCGFGIQYQNL